MTFEAVPHNERKSIQPPQGNIRDPAFPWFSRRWSTETSISSRIDDLQEMNADLVKEISDLKVRLATEIETRGRMEAELNLVNDTNHLLKGEVDRKAKRGDYFEKASYKYAEGVRKLLPMIEALRDTTTFRADGSF